MNNTKKPEIVVGVLVYNENKEIFLAKAHKWGDRWIVPGGHLEYGETLIECVSREVKEETNLDVRDIEIIDIQDSIFSKEFHRECHMVFLDYCCKQDSYDIQLNDELQEYIWIDPKEALKKLNLNSSTREFIERFVEKRLNR
jgi:nucleoside triphosphatase